MGNAKKKILIIEDDAAIQAMYKIKFESDGFDVLTAAAGTEGFEIAKKDKPSIIMLDIILPQMDGFAVLQELKSNSKTKSIPVIMLTNLGTDEDKARGKKLGAVDYIVKANFTPAKVNEAIKKYL